MKVVNILRKIFLSLAAVALLAAYLIGVYVVWYDDAVAKTNTVVQFALYAFIPLSIFIIGLILGESKESSVHKLGIGLHLTVSILFVVASAYWYLQRYMLNLVPYFDRFTVPVYCILGGMFVYYASFIFQAVESSLKAKAAAAEEQCQCGCCNCGCEQNQECSEQSQYQDPMMQQMPPAYPYPPYPPYGYYPPFVGMPVVQPVIQQPVQQQVQQPMPTEAKVEVKVEQPKVEPVKEEPKAEESIMPEDDVHVAALMKWKKLYLEGIVTEREFIRKRDEILGLRRQ